MRRTGRVEVLATSTPLEDGGAWTVTCSLRALATRMGLAKNTAHRALSVLREARLIEFVQCRSGAGRLGSCVYRLTLPAEVLAPVGRTTSTASGEGLEARRALLSPPVGRSAAVAAAQQVVLFQSV